MPRRKTIGLLLASLLLLPACFAYLDNYHYMPRPAVLEVPATTQGQPSQVTTMAVVVGIRREDKDAHLPLSVEIRLRVDNNGPRTVTLDPQALELTGGTFTMFPPPIVEPAQPITLAPARSATITANFPFPPRHRDYNTDLSSLQLRWTMALDDQPSRQVVSFTRVYPLYYPDPYYDYPYPYPYYYPRGGFVVTGHFGHRR